MDVESEISSLRERVVKLETKVEELNKDLESIRAYIRTLYEYLIKRT
ncbi:MAG: hypothetical protein ABDH32_06525 [Candidatus Caldarchaeales archaeon]